MLKKKRSPSLANRLRTLKHAVPFAPFKVTSAAGETFEVVAADDFIVSPLGTTAFFNPKGKPTTRLVYLDDVHAIDLIRRSRRQNTRRSNGRGGK